MNTRAGSIFGQPGCRRGLRDGERGSPLSHSRGVKLVGTDGWSWDPPFNLTAKKWLETKDPSIIWEGHKNGREIPYWQMEKLHNLEKIPADGFIVACFPVKIGELRPVGHAAWQ